MKPVERENDPNLRAAARSLRVPGESCPSDEDLFAYLTGGAAGRAETMREHLARCRRCSATARDALAFAATWPPATESRRALGPLPRRLAWAAVLALLVGAPWLLPTSRPAPPAPGWKDLPLQAAPFATAQPGERWRGAETADASAASLATAMEAYGRAEYPAAVVALDQHLRRWPADGLARFYCGVALLLEDRAADAVARLEEAAELEPALPRGELEWYLALAYLRDGQPDKAVAALGTVEAVSVERRDAALGLRRKILAGR